MKCPCKDCEIRMIGCHSLCSAYKVWKQTREVISIEREKENIRRNLSHDHEMKYRKRLKQGGMKK